MRRYTLTIQSGGQSQFLRTCLVADEKHVQNSAGSTSMASEDFGVDGIA